MGCNGCGMGQEECGFCADVSRKVQPLVRQKLSERIKRRLSLCNKCGGTGSYERDDYDEPLACMSCFDWLSALQQVELLEEIALRRNLW